MDQDPSLTIFNLTHLKRPKANVELGGFALTLTRAWIPCQDTPSGKVTYTAVITGPEKFKVLMSAPPLKTFYKNSEDGDKRKRISTFQQIKPVATYLIVMASSPNITRKVIKTKLNKSNKSLTAISYE